MRQLSLLVASIIAFFIMVSFFLKSQTYSLHKPELVLTTNEQTPQTDKSKQDESASHTSTGSPELIENGFTQTKPITPGLTQGRVIMPSLKNDTLKYDILTGPSYS